MRRFCIYIGVISFMAVKSCNPAYSEPINTSTVAKERYNSWGVIVTNAPRRVLPEKPKPENWTHDHIAGQQKLQMEEKAKLRAR